MYSLEDNFHNLISKHEFAVRLDSFMTEFSISVGKLAQICHNGKLCSKSSCHRLRTADVAEKYYRAAIPLMETRLEEWMQVQNWNALDIETQLTKLFPHRSDRTMIINRCVLTATAIKFFGLKADPFDVDQVPGDDEMFTNPELDDIIARLKDAVLYKGFVCLSGAVGTGKTSLKIRLHRELNEWSKKSRQRVHLLYPEFFDMNAVNVGSIASYILEEFEVKNPRDSTIRVRKIKQLLTSLEKDDARVALVFDECHRLNEKVLVSLKNFWEMTNGGYARLLGVVLFGQPKFVESTLRDHKFREIAERVQVLEMPSIEKSAAAYLTHKIAAAGGDINKLFNPKAVQRICANAKTPLSLGNLANNALMEAFKLEEKQVVSEMLKLRDKPQILNLRAA